MQLFLCSHTRTRTYKTTCLFMEKQRLFSGKCPGTKGERQVFDWSWILCVEIVTTIYEVLGRVCSECMHLIVE